ncbi:DEAD/DEAH box helicase family protein, partial [Acidithiobacillus sp.]|uniref:DEAD/DEAH box helicase family protein n=1 Tax=Acidithiobacillus sp. TaxID=1872118 RepID=UPI003D072C64
MSLRDYQQRTIDDIYAWWSDHPEGHPCAVLPPGSGKSWIIAALCADMLQSWPDMRILMLTHVRELIVQNAEKMRLVWPGAPMGVYSAGLGKKQLGEPITFAGIQSVRGKSYVLGHVDLVIVDECHLIGHNEEGGYRTLIAELQAINPNLRVLGFTATPWRLGHGLITDKPAIFDGPLIEPVTIEELMYKGHLADLRSKLTKARLTTEGVHKRGGDFIEAELQAKLNTPMQNSEVVQETIRLGQSRKSWLFFCAGVDHALAVRDELRAQGISAECVTGKTPKGERDQILAEFKAKKIRALTNANVLTTGTDVPDIDLIALMRPTLSPALYVQMVGRGTRIKTTGAKDCLVLDFAGVVETHGPITAVQPPVKSGGVEPGEAPTKTCESCGELCAISAVFCPACGAPFPPREPKVLALRDNDIMGRAASEMDVQSWRWKKHISKTSGKEMLAVTYYGDLSDPSVTEYFSVTHEGYAGQKAIKQVASISQRSGARLEPAAGLDSAATALTESVPPTLIEFKKDGKFFNVIRRIWNE